MVANLLASQPEELTFGYAIINFIFKAADPQVKKTVIVLSYWKNGVKYLTKKKSITLELISDRYWP